MRRHPIDICIHTYSIQNCVLFMRLFQGFLSTLHAYARTGIHPVYPYRICRCMRMYRFILPNLVRLLFPSIQRVRAPSFSHYFHIDMTVETVASFRCTCSFPRKCFCHCQASVVSLRSLGMNADEKVDGFWAAHRALAAFYEADIARLEADGIDQRCGLYQQSMAKNEDISRAVHSRGMLPHGPIFLMSQQIRLATSWYVATCQQRCW